MAGEDTASGSIARSVTGNPVFVLTALGLILYGILRLANSLFYTRLEVKPEEVGLGYAETLSQSAVGVLVVLGFGFAIFGLLVFLLVYVMPAGARQQRESSPPTAIEKVLLVGAFALVASAGSRRTRSGTSTPPGMPSRSSVVHLARSQGFGKSGPRFAPANRHDSSDRSKQSWLFRPCWRSS